MALALSEIGPEARAAIPELIRNLADSNTYYAQMAAEALGNIGPVAKEAVPALRELAAKFDNKKSKEGQTIMATLKLISGAKKKK